MKPLNVGVIGAGIMGQKHIKTYLSKKNCLLVGVVEKDISKYESLQESFNVPIYKDIYCLLDNVEAVSIATPASTHYELAKFLLENKKHVLLEKPITYTVNQANDLIKIAKDNNMILAVGHIERFNPVFGVLYRILSEEQPFFIEIHREGPYDPRIFDVDVIMDFMIHDLDLLTYLYNDRLLLKSAYGINIFSEKSDIVSAQLFEKNGTMINITSNRASEQRKRKWKLLFHNKTIEIDLLNRKISYFEQKNGMAHIISDYYNSIDPLILEISNFLDCITSGSKPTVDGIQGLNALSLSEQIQIIVSRQNNSLMVI